MVASTMGGVGGFMAKFMVLRSKTTTEELPFPVNRIFPSGVTSSPSGPDIGFTPLEREAQHWAPGNPPKLPLAPKPEARWKGGFLHPKRVKLPRTETIGGILGSQGLAWLPAPATALEPWIAFTARFCLVSTTTTARPMRSEI